MTRFLISYRCIDTTDRMLLKCHKLHEKLSLHSMSRRRDVLKKLFVLEHEIHINVTSVGNIVGSDKSVKLKPTVICSTACGHWTLDL